MSDVRPIRELLAGLDELQGVLDDLNVKYVTIAANGHWSYEKLGRSRHGRDTLERGQILRVAELIPPGRPLRSGEWALRKAEGVSGPSILIERLPMAVADRLPQDVLAAMRRQVKQTGNGVLVGEPGSGKGALLLWLALQIPDQPVLYIAENPPSEFPGTHVMHVFPPSSQAERRALERFVRLSPTVMWDRVVNADDLQTLYGFPGARRRWFTTDASSVRSALRLLTAAGQNGCDARFSTMLYLASSVIGRPEARNLLLRQEDGWEEAWAAEESALGLLEAYDTSDIRRLGPTEMSTPSIVLSDVPKVEVAEDFAAEAESFAEPVRVEAPEPAQTMAAADESDHPHTVEVDLADVEELEERDQQTDAITGMLPRDEIRDLREQGLVPDDSNEIPALVAASVAETTRAYLQTPTEVGNNETTNPSAYLNSIIPGLDLDEDDAPQLPTMNLNDLRITTMEDISEEDLESISEAQEATRGYSGVFSSDLDFESLAEEMLSEISEADSVADDPTAMGATNPNRIVIIDSEIPRGRPEPEDDGDNRTVAGGADILRLAEKLAAEHNQPEEGEDSTKEFTLNERLLMLRKRRTDD